MMNPARLPGESAVERQPTRPSALRGIAFTLVHGVLLAACLFVFLRGWARDFRVPLNLSSDSPLALMQSKSTVDNGWWWFNPRIGAPFGLDELAFPANANVDQAVVWIVSRFVRDPATAINLAWLLIVVLSGLTATWCIRKLGASRIAAAMAGTLFALSPYALYRNLDHFWMVIYLVPFPCAAALLLASGRLERWSLRSPFIWLLAGCALLGFNYVYYAFFGSFIITIAGVAGCVEHRRPRVLLPAAICVAVIAGCTLLNLAPSLYSWRQHGRPLILRDKRPAESEVYGLKLRQLVSPAYEYRFPPFHRFPPFRAWIAREQSAEFPLETENQTSRLGLVGTLGFLTLLALLFVPRVARALSDGDTLLAASRLTLAAVLLGTIGGFGSLFSLLMSPEIRAYNRIAPFIAFFSLAAVALVLDSVFRRPSRKLAAAIATVLLGLVDQRAAAVQLNAAHSGIAAEVSGLTSFVRQIESKLPAGAMVLQLPFRTFLNDEGVARMQPYEHLKFYLVSRTIRWSYPALSNRQVRWQQAAAALEPTRLARELATQGFAAILIDRYGYQDNGAAIAAALRDPSDREPVIAETARYLALDIRRLAIGAAATGVLATAASLSPATIGMTTCTGQPLMNIDRIGSAITAGRVESPHVERSGEFKVSGWAVDQSAGKAAAGVDVVLDATPFQTIYGTDRDDVAAYFKQPRYLQSGFVAAIPGGRFGRGPHTLSLRVVSAEGHCYYQSPPQTVIVD